MNPSVLKKQLKDWTCVRRIRRSEFFDEAWYRRRTGLPADTDAAAHYYREGWKTTDPSPRFPQDLYCESNPDVREAGICPLAHYLIYGKIHHRVRYPGMVLNHYHALPVTRGFLRRLAEIRDAGLIRRNRDARILVVVHIFYIDSIPEIVQYLKNLRRYRTDLLVTTVEGPDAEEIGRRIRKPFPEARVLICPNRGFDIGPFWQAMDEIDLSAYDLVFKLQSKRHFPKEGRSAAGLFIRGRDWFLYLFRATVGAGWVHRNVDQLTRKDGPDLAAAECLLQQDPPFRARIVQKTLAEYGVSLPEGYRFVAGSCFGIRAKALEQLRGIPVKPEDFETAERGKFTLAHAMERYISGAVPENKKLGNPVCRRRQRANQKAGRETLDAYWDRIRLGEEYHLPDEFIQDFLESHAIHSSAYFRCAPESLRVREKSEAQDGQENLEELRTHLIVEERNPGEWKKIEKQDQEKTADLVLNQRGEVLLGADILSGLREKEPKAKKEIGILRLETDLPDEDHGKTGPAKEKKKG